MKILSTNKKQHRHAAVDAKQIGHSMPLSFFGDPLDDLPSQQFTRILQHSSMSAAHSQTRPRAPYGTKARVCDVARLTDAAPP